MAIAKKKITLSPSRDIPFHQLVLSQANVRHVRAGVSIEELAEDIARRGLLQGLSVRPVVDADGVETGMFEIPAGGRRYRALELLVKQKRLARSAPVPCVVREDGIAEEDSLAENVQRAPLHPLDQFRAFLALREKGQSEEEIAAAFFVSVGVVKQRLKLASVSPRLLDTYAEDGMSLDQLMAFTVSGDHARQEQVFERLQQAYDKQPHVIRRMLTEGAVRASDKRARFVGVEAYVEAGGTVLRDLFQGDDGGWLQDVALVDRMVADKLKAASESIAAEGWKWIEVAPDFAYGHTFGLRQLRGEPIPMTAEEQMERDAVQAEVDRLSKEYQDDDELPDDIDARLGELEAELEAWEDRPLAFDPSDIAQAGAFVSITHDGSLRVERGYVRPEDEMPAELEANLSTCDSMRAVTAVTHDADAVATDAEAPEPEEDDGLSPISDRLMTELTAHRTLGLRQALGEQPDMAFLAALHALVLKAFYHYGSDSCLELDFKSVGFSTQAPGLNDSFAAGAIRVRHERWANALPKESAELWDALEGWDADSRSALFAHVVSLSVNAVHEAWNRRPRALAHADRLALAVDLDMAALGWRPTVDTFLGRVTKARILQAVTEVKGQRAAERIAHLKKGNMATEAETLLAETGWLPEPLRTPGYAETNGTLASEPDGEETAGKDGETAMGQSDDLTDTDEAGTAVHVAAAS
ncbi:ParB/RepB/Spo0J family partition protein [Xanthobacter wiegelii]|uniref:ParB/RepB/Spo0J family partition protein n=1 Tax=Xanthobacter wiegelii TaxID=3119913 RepID=UPI003726B47F